MKSLTTKFLAICSMGLLVGLTPHKSHSDSLCHIFTESSERIPVTASTGIDQPTFNRVIDNFITIYGPIVKKEGFKLSIARKWSDETINANTTVNGSSWVINAYGGLARYPTMDYNAFLMVMCHEMYHHLGGYPKVDGWASNEGGADYGATMKCFRLMSANGMVDNLNKSNIPQSVKDTCAKNHQKIDAVVCMKNAETGFTLASILNKLSGATKSLSFDTPDTSEVAHTDNEHPAAQCRLDTYYNGAVCNVPYTQSFADDEPITGSCSEENKETVGIRPRCWYKPAL